MFSCKSNFKLSQEKAEEAVKSYLLMRPAYLKYGILEVRDFDQLSQFSDNEATINARTYDDYIVLKFTFKKNIDNKWVLTSIIDANRISAAPHGYFEWISRQRDLNFIIDK